MGMDIPALFSVAQSGNNSQTHEQINKTQNKHMEEYYSKI